jgi:hypothetical protein
MKRFLLHTTVFLAILVASFFAIYKLADGTTDAFYVKFTSPKQTSLIVGSSRAAQGIQPNVIDSIYGSNNLYNYAFTIVQSPYGKAYYNSIFKKLNKTSKKGVFILDVNPWTLSQYKTSNINDSGYREDNTFLANTQFVNFNPNIEYLLESFKGKNEAIIRSKNRKGLYQTFYAHDNGWLEVTIESDMVSKIKRTKNKTKAYRKRLNQYNGFSEYRYNYLNKTIQLLQKQGEVYLVRLPVIEDMLDIENELIPDFDEIMNEVANKNKVPYINMMSANENYDYTDGQHLTVTSAKQFSLDLAIQMNKMKK